MTNLVKKSLVIGGLLAATSMAALALPHTPKADVNKDGQVTEAEFMSAADARFKSADVNIDQMLSEDERKNARRMESMERSKSRFAAMDSNGDGSVSEAEFNAQLEARAEKRDAIRAEHDAKREARSNDDRKGKRGDRKTMRKDSSGGKQYGRRGGRMSADANNDGMISRAEFDVATKAAFLRMDKDADGVLTQGEGRKDSGKKRGKRRGR